MRVISRSALSQFGAKHADSEQALKTWYKEVTGAVWLNPADLKSHFCSASILQAGRVVFNIAGNKYRLVTFVLYGKQAVFVKFIGSHAQYNLIDAQTIELNQGGK